MSPWRSVVPVLAAALAAATVARAAGPDGTAAAVRLLDVPYVAQSEDLCGGAAVAMVLRYWGATGVVAEDFAHLRQGAGIRARALVEAVADRGWTALPVAGAQEVRDHVARGRPVIALIRAGAAGHHYVVLVAWANGWVVLHDPSVGPLRTVREDEFTASWAASDSWALLILPPRVEEGRGVAPAGRAEEGRRATPSTDPLTDAAVALARAGDLDGAQRALKAAHALRPAAAAPLRELAGLRFRAGDWSGARALALRAVALDPRDEHAWRLAGASAYLAGDVEGALAAWNRLGEPRVDLARIDGLARVRHGPVAAQIGLATGELLGPGEWRRARRRLAELPALAASRVVVRPLPSGLARVEVAALERSSSLDGPARLARLGAGALVDREVVVDVVSPTGGGELWQAAWRFAPRRPRVAVTLRAPGTGGRPGIWSVEGTWERQTYARGATEVVEDRRRAALSWADWVGADLRVEVSAASDAWSGRGAHASLATALETRWADDRLAAGVRAGAWASLEGGSWFGHGALEVAWASDGLARRAAWRLQATVAKVTAAAPLALWPGAGAGHGREPLLRAHPLLDDRGVLSGPVFGRALAQATLERQWWPWSVGPARAGWAVFVDAARAAHGGAARSGQIDAGVGLRLRSGGGDGGALRLDVGRGLADGAIVVSAGWLVAS